MANAQVALGANGYADDLVLTATGDLALLVDTIDDPAASRQLLNRIVLTCPILRDGSGSIIAAPDDIFNKDFGSGVRALIGQPLTNALAAQIQNSVLAAITASAAFAPVPAPTVAPFINGNGADGKLFIAVTATTNLGYLVTLTVAVQQS